MNATETRYANLMKLTVADLKGIADRMATPYASRIRKADLVNAIMMQIDMDQSEAIQMDEEMFSVKKDEFMFAGILWTGKPAQMLRFHDTAVRRYNPTFKKGKDGMVILTAKQRKRIHKKDRVFSKRIGLSV